MANPQNYFISDFHFNHGNIINFERTQFETIQEHDDLLVKKITEWALKLPKGSTLWNLGDFGSTDYLWTIDILRNAGIHCIFMYGNHDSASDLEKFKSFFDEVYQYPTYISNRIAISHIPIAVWDDTINVHGHLHGSILDSQNYISCSLNDVNWEPISEKYIQACLGKLPKYTRRFMWEPFADMMKFSSHNREDIIVDKNGKIDLAASRVMQKLNQNKK